MKRLWLKRIQLGLIHVALTITLLPFNSTLNRVMKKELAVAATVIAILLSLPYLLSPLQVALGSYADRNPIFGRRRIPYIVLGLALCIGGAFLAPSAAFALAEGGQRGLILSAVAFGVWGMGYNFATVSYFSLASELGDEKSRSYNIATMFTMMIISIIVMATIISQMVDPYTPEALQRVFWMVGIVAAVLGVLGLIGLEGPYTPGDQTEERHSWGQMYSAILNNKQASLFFVYLVLLLSAILGQDVLLEPYAAEAFGLSVEQTTRITSIWGTFFLITLIGAGPLQGRVDKKSMARIGAWLALVSFALIVLSGVLKLSSMFYVGVVLLGAGTGLSTVSNLSLMLDMTTVGNVGLFIGAWGVSSAVARLIGTMISGVVYDVVTAFANNDLVRGYIVVFGIEFLFLLTSVYLLRRVDVGTFREEAQEPMTFVERAALVGRAGD